MSSDQQQTGMRMYALVENRRWNDAYLLSRDIDGRLCIRSVDGDEDLVEDEDFDGLTGLLTWEGRRYDSKEEAIAAGAMEPDDYWNPDWSWFQVGKWRPMTIKEAVDLGLLTEENALGTRAGDT